MKTHFFRYLGLMIVLIGAVIFVYTIQTDQVLIYSVSADTIFVSPGQRSTKEDRKFTTTMTSTETFSTTTKDTNQRGWDKKDRVNALAKKHTERVAELESRGLNLKTAKEASTIVNMESRSWFNTSDSHSGRTRIPNWDTVTDAIQPGNDLSKHNFDIQSIRLLQGKYKQSTSSVLLVTYLRSGSTWLGDITSQAENSFYVYEPFKNFIMQGYYANNSVCYNNNTCREPRKDCEHHQLAIASLHQIYTCDFLNMHRWVLQNVVRSQRKECLQQVVLKSERLRRETRQLQLSECIKYMTQKCFQAKYRIVKTIRLSMELVEALMNDVSNLKVINLVRDPRGITNSRMRGRFSLTRDAVPHSINLCTRMYNDVKLGDQLRKKYPEKFALVMYEALAERPMEGARYVFKFLNATYSEQVQQWVYDSSHGRSDGFYSTTRNSSAALSHWRGELNFSRVIIIQNNCQHLFNLLGYIPFKTYEEMRDFESKSRITAYRSGFL